MHSVMIESSSCLSDSKANGSICHPYIGFQVSKTMEKYAIPTLESFDLWMSKSKHDTFAIVINFINSQWAPCHVIMGLFEATNTIGITMVM